MYKDFGHERRQWQHEWRGTSARVSNKEHECIDLLVWQMLWASTKAFDAIAIASTTIIIIMVIIISAQALCQCTSAYTCEVHIHLDVWVPKVPICSTFGYGCEDP